MDGHDAIFAKIRFTPGQFRAVAARRFGDAKCLVDSGNVERANGAICLAGFAIECLLKSTLLIRSPNLQRAVDPAKLSSSDKKGFAMLHGHDLDAMVEFCS
jgi:hypothetical protein